MPIWWIIRKMIRRYGIDRPATARTTVADVFLATVRDPWAKGKLGEVYQKIFERGGVRVVGHRIIVEPKNARAEINEVYKWMTDRFGEAFVTARAEPFEYLSGKNDYWVTYFAALVYRGDASLENDFNASAAGMSWASYAGVSRTSAGSASTASESSTSEPVAESSVARAKAFFLRPFVPRERAHGRAVTPSTGQVIVTSPPAPFTLSPERVQGAPGIVERFLGVKAQPAAPLPPPAPASASGGGRWKWRSEEEEQREIEEEAARARQAKIDRLIQFGKGPPPATSASFIEEPEPSAAVREAFARATRESGIGKARPRIKGEEARSVDELDRERLKNEIRMEEQVKAAARARAAREEEDKSTVEKYARPENPHNPGVL